MRLVYKLGLGIIVAGLIIVLSAGALGGMFYEGLMQLLTLAGAPAERDFLPPSQPENGELILQMLGSLVLLCGACIISARLLLGLLGYLAAGLLQLVGKPNMAAKLGWAAAPGWFGNLVWIAKLGLAAAAIGFLVFVFTAVPELLLYEIFLYEYGTPGVMATLGTLYKVGLGMFWTGLALLILGKPIQALLSYWLNALGLGLTLIGAIGALLGLGTPFIIAGVIGGAMLVVGAWRFLTARNADARLRGRIRRRVP